MYINDLIVWRISINRLILLVFEYIITNIGINKARYIIHSR